MNIAILNVNTDRSTFAKNWPDDFEKFSILIRETRPDWSFHHFDMVFEQHPEDLTHYDGYVITGSPASVNSDETWIHSAIKVVQELIEIEKPIFGACFGHQLIAKALGVDIVDNPNGWVFGTTNTHLVNRADWMTSSDDKAIENWSMYAAHAEQVSVLPHGATLLCQNEQCAIGGFALGNSILTTQYHPEMTHDFIGALVIELGDKLSPEVSKRAMNSLNTRSDRALFGNWICQFFEAGIAA